MSQTPIPTVLLPNLGAINLAIRYERRFTTLNDVTHDEDHIHHFYEIYVNLKGDVSFLVENNLYSINRGDIIVTKPNELHRCIYHNDCIHEHFCIWFRSAPNSPSVFEDCLDQSTLVVLSDEDKEAFINQCFSLYKNHGKEGVYQIHAAKSYFNIIDSICNNRHRAMQTQNLPGRFSEIVDYILLHYSETTCSVDSICEEFFISKSTLLRRFRQYFQTTPSAYIESKRFSEAKKLLVAGHSVQNACYASGFTDCSYFIMRFRKKFGMTPYKYQKEFMDPVSAI
ncbi:MAG: AraC family transcriptional regulator [Ruminococcaceae bacterium]|nr:AraC family transcriptional regulator [Oscillospiraceae bacterium]